MFKVEGMLLPVPVLCIIDIPEALRNKIMPYNIFLKRNTILDNHRALIANKKVAEDLIQSEPALYNCNDAEKFYFKNLTVEDLNGEYLEMHFQLLVDIGTSAFILSFWKDWIDIEFSKEEDIVGLFNQIKYLSAQIIKHDFSMEDPIEDRTWDLERGLEINMVDYAKWCGSVNKVEHIVRKRT